MSSNPKSKSSTTKIESAEPLQQTEMMYHEIFENALDGIFRATLRGQFTLVNPAMARLYGYPSPSEMTEGVADIAREIFADPQSYRKFVRKLKEDGRVDKYEVRNLRKDGSLIWVSITARAVLGGRGKVVYYEGSVRDVTGRKQADLSLRDSEKLYQQAIEAIGAVPYHQIYVHEFGRTHIEYQYIGDGIRQITGYDPKEFSEAIWNELILETHLVGDLAQYSMEDAIQLMRSGKSPAWKCEIKIRARDGSIRWIYDTAVKLLDESGFSQGTIGSFQDITERKLSEERLRENEAIFDSFMEHSPVYVFFKDKEIRSLRLSKNYEQMLGMPVSEALGKTMDDLFPSELAKSMVADDMRILYQGERVEVVEELNGHVYETVKFPIFKDGMPNMLAGFTMDITDRKLAEAKLRENEEKMRSIFRVAPAGIGVVSDRILLDVNERICEMTGYTRDELVGKSSRVLYPTQDEFEHVGREKYEQISREGTGTVETLWQRKDGSIINIILASTPVDANDLSKGVTFTALDVTERKHAEDAMRAIAEVSRDISSTLQLDVVLERIASYAKSLLNAVTSAVYLVEPTASMLRAISVIGLDDEQIKNDPIRPGEGILGNITLQKWGEIVNDTSMDPRGIEIKGTEVTPYEHLMGVPVLLKDRLTGLIVVWRVGEGKEFKPNELDFLTSLAQQVGIAIENARLFDATQRRLREMEAVIQISASVSQTLDLESLLEEILETTIHAIPPAERGSILLADDKENLHIRAVWGYADPRVRNFCFSSDSGYSTIAFHERRPIVIPDVRADDDIRYDGDILEMLSGGSAIAAPLIVKNRAIGVVAIDTPQKNDAFNQDDLQLLVAIAASAGLAIDNARLFDETRRRLSDLEALHAVSSALRTARNLDEALPILLNQLMKLLDAGGATLEMLDRESGEIVTQLARGAWEPVTGLRTPRNEGISGRVIATGQPYISPDVIADGLAVRPDLFAGITCVACVPVIAQHEPIGALWIGRQVPIKEHEIGLLAAIGEMVGNAIHRMGLYEQTERQLKRLDALRIIERTINSSLDLRVTLNILLEQLVAQLDADAAAILLLNPHTFMLEYTASKGLRNVNALGSIRLGESATSRAVMERSLCSFPDLTDIYQELERPALMSNEEVLAYHAAPLIAKGQVKGVLEVFHRSPYHPEAEWLAFLQSLAEQAAIAIDNAELFNNLQRSNDELTLAYDNTLAGWAQALDLREKETGDHSNRVTELTLRLAIALGVPDIELVHIRRGALLHDIGKVGIPDAILLKPGPLTEDEKRIMQMHPVYARDLLRPITYLQPAIDIPYCHQEKWDGSGYPQGLSGEAIPLAARIFAVVDVWDALLSDRPYRPAWSREKAREYIRSQSGLYFDPRVVEMFLKVVP